MILATNNNKKVKEIQNKLKNIKLKTLKDINFSDDIIENGLTLKENAKIKIDAIKKYYNDEIIISDDTGLFVQSLDWEPGIFAKRFANDTIEYKDNIDLANNNKMMKMLDNKPNRYAYFETIICLYIPNQGYYYFSGKLEGEIALKIDENPMNSFGYDPIFKYKNKYLSQMDIEEKNKISHRGKAIEELIEYLKGYDDSL